MRQKGNDTFQLTDVDFYVVKECFLPDHDFWCSDFIVDCSKVEIASAYSQFYQELDARVMANKNLSGFLTDLPQAKANTYANSGFRIIKEKSYNQKVNIPIISQNDGNYLIVKVENTGAGIEKGLAAIRKYAKENNLKIGNDLWQFNIGLNIEKLVLIKNGILAYKILK